MREQLAKLEAYVAHPALECAASLPAVLVGKKLKVCNRGHMEDGGDRLFLLPLICNAVGYGLQGGNVGFPQFKMGRWLPIGDDDREPWVIASVSH